MDYTKAPLGFRIRKALRYVRMYGVSRTLAKIRGQYHMRSCYEPLPSRRKMTSSTGHAGLIGCGNFAFSTVAWFLPLNSFLLPAPPLKRAGKFC